MDKKQVIDYVKKHPSGKVKIAITDIDGILRGKYISADKFLSVVGDQTGFCDVVFGWDANDTAYDNTTYTGWHTGYPDAPVRLDINTFRKIPWENDVPFFLGELMNEKSSNAKTSAFTSLRTDKSAGEKEPSHVCPRQLVKKLSKEANDLGFSAVFSQEFEWFNFSETPHSANQKNFRNLTPITPGMFGYSILRSTLQNPFFTDLFEYLRKFNVPLEGLHTETGPGVLEAAIEYGSLVESADRAVLFKSAVKEIAYKHGIMATFMAKIHESLPGCGGHIHQSLWDSGQKKNLFYSDTDKKHMSEEMKWYVAGQLFCLPHVLPMYAPTVNSYKRLVEGAWAPTTLTWALDNRTVALRVLSGGSKSCRLETRVVGSDANPYLAMAAALASGLYGIRKKMKLKQPETAGNGYRDHSKGTLPATLAEATQHMKESAVAKEILGGKFVEHFVQTREWEWRQHLKAVTDWEYRRYFEII
jgi:glutamine synthetase